MSGVYVGIGSRETPVDILEMMEDVAAKLAEMGYTLRSGHARGADTAFEKGCDSVNGKKQIFLPWKGFEGSESPLIVKTGQAFELARLYHTHWHRLSEGGKKLQARNGHQVLGWDLKTPAEFVLCWTKAGSGGGGTGQAIRIAKEYDIPVIDLGLFDNPKEIIKGLLLMMDCEEDSCRYVKKEETLKYK